MSRQERSRRQGKKITDTLALACSHCVSSDGFKVHGDVARQSGEWSVCCFSILTESGWRRCLRRRKPRCTGWLIRPRDFVYGGRQSEIVHASILSAMDAMCATELICLRGASQRLRRSDVSESEVALPQVGQGGEPEQIVFKGRKPESE